MVSYDEVWEDEFVAMLAKPASCSWPYDSVFGERFI